MFSEETFGVRKVLTTMTIFSVLLGTASAIAVPKNRVIISSGPVMPAGLSKKPEGFFGNLLGDKYILNDLQVEGITAFPPGKIFTIYQRYLKQVVDIQDIKVITERIKKLYIDNDLPAPKIILPLSRFTPELAVIEVLEPRALKRIHANPVTLGEILKKQEAKKKVLRAAKPALAATQDISETEVAPLGIATTIQQVSRLAPTDIQKPEPKVYTPGPLMIESLDVIGSNIFDPAYLKSLALPLVDKLFSIQDLLALTVDIQNAYQANNKPLPHIHLSLEALLDKRIELHIHDDGMPKALVEDVVNTSDIAVEKQPERIVEPLNLTKELPVITPPVTAIATPEIQPITIEREEVERGIFLISS